jgi:23S rRNA pseudouridine1911/1915/1917 synthase
MFTPEDILYEDNHLIAVNKHAGDLVQSDPEGNPALEDEIKEYIRQREGKPGEAFLGVVHRIDRPVSGVVLFAKTSKALVRLNEMIKNREIRKTYWAITEEAPAEAEATLKHYIVRDGKTNLSRAYTAPRGDSKEALLKYRIAGTSSNYTLLEVELITGRHHQIRSQLAAIGCHIRGDLKYGAKRSNREGGISLHSRTMSFIHPVKKEPILITAPTSAGDNLWAFFESMTN